MAAARIAGVRELKSELAKLKAENARLRDENAMYASHMALSVLAASDLDSLPPGGNLVIMDGWNLVLGAGRIAHSPAGLIEKAREHLKSNPADFVWIIFDGPRENAFEEGRLRVSYTGGEGSQRADRMVCDFLRMARLSGRAGRIVLKTNDKALAKEAARITGRERATQGA